MGLVPTRDGPNAAAGAEASAPRMPGMAAAHAAAPLPLPSFAKPVGTLKWTCHSDDGASTPSPLTRAMMACAPMPR